MLQKLRNKVVSRIASRHIAGKDIGDAVRVCQWAADKNYATILAFWANGGKLITPFDKADNFKGFKKAIETIKQKRLNSFLSIKLDAIGYDFGMFKELLEIAKDAGVRLHIDSLGPEAAGQTFQMIEQADEYHDILGCTLPSRWERSLEDTERVVDLKLAVRIVKGQWEDPLANIDSRKNYLAIVEKLANNAKHVGIATHDKALAQKAISILGQSNTFYEIEQFFSLPMNAILLAEHFKCPFRIYIPYGSPSIPYNYKFALTRPALASWMVSDFAFNFKKPWDNYQNGTKKSNQ